MGIPGEEMGQTRISMHDKDLAPFLELALVAICAAAMVFWPSAGGWLLLIAALPWAARAAAGGFRFRSTPLDLPLALFLATAGMGVWAAYDRGAAWAKFCLLAGAVLLFHALARQPRRSLWPLAGALFALDVLLAAFFLLAYDWVSTPVDLAAINRVGVAWMGLRPHLFSGALQADRAGDLIATLAPFGLACAFRFWQRREWPAFWLTAAGGGVALAGLLLTSSWTSWLALAVALGLWLSWGLSGWAAARFSWRRPVAFAVFLLAPAAALLAAVRIDPGGWVARIVAGGLAGRAQLAANTLRLLGDYLFTGGGLAGFAGEYSQYILFIPSVYYPNSHNIYLDIALEQGLAGAAAFLVVFGGSFWLLLNGAARVTQDLAGEPPAEAAHEPALLPVEQPGMDGLRRAVAAGLLVATVQGLADDPLYGGGGTPLLFALSGLAVALAQGATLPKGVRVHPRSSASHPMRQTREKRVWIFPLAMLLAVAAWAYFFWRPVGAQWYADLGAVDMARVELANFPSGQWDDGQRLPALARAEGLFRRALSLDEANFTAHYRLGMTAMLGRDFGAAQAHLEAAGAIQSGHRGVRKMLGLCYAWNGEFERALPLLEGIPEASVELRVYPWYWRTQGREDLARRAEQMLAVLEGVPGGGAP